MMAVSWLDANFATIVNGLALGSVLFIIAVGLSLVFGTMNVLNLAHGGFAFLGAYVGVGLATAQQSLAMAALALVLAFALGAVLGVLLAAMTHTVDSHLRQALLTLGVALVIGELVREFFGPDVRSVPPPAALGGSVDLLGSPYPVYRLFLVAIGVAVAVVLYVVLEKTKVGALVRASVADRDMVEAIGVRTSLLMGGVFAAGAGLASMGGLLASPVLGVQPGLDDTILLLALVVVVIGGLGSVRGALLGALLVGQVQSLGVAVFPQIASFLLFGMMGAVLLLRPKGLLPSRAVSQA